MSKPEPPTRNQTVRAATAELIARVPIVGNALKVVFNDSLDRRAARREAWLDGLAEGLTQQQLDDLEELLAHDEQLQDVLWAGLEAASKSRLEIQRRAFGRILAAAINEPVADERDITELLNLALTDMRPVHVETLAWLAAQSIEQVLVRKAEAREAQAGLAPDDPRVATLVRHGLVTEGSTYGGMQRITGVSDYGRRLLAFLAVGTSAPQDGGR